MLNARLGTFVLGAIACVGTGCIMPVRTYREINGRVIDADTGTPITGAEVTACLLDASLVRIRLTALLPEPVSSC